MFVPMSFFGNRIDGVFRSRFLGEKWSNNSISRERCFLYNILPWNKFSSFCSIKFLFSISCTAMSIAWVNVFVSWDITFLQLDLDVQLGIVLLTVFHTTVVQHPLLLHFQIPQQIIYLLTVDASYKNPWYVLVPHKYRL